MKLRVGNRVKMLSTATSVDVEAEEVGKVGTIIYLSKYLTAYCGIRVQMDNICKARGYIPTWAVGAGMIKLVPVKGQQLLFDFVK